MRGIQHSRASLLTSIFSHSNLIRIYIPGDSDSVSEYQTISECVSDFTFSVPQALIAKLIQIWF